MSIYLPKRLETNTTILKFNFHLATVGITCFYEAGNFRNPKLCHLEFVICNLEFAIWNFPFWYSSWSSHKKM